MDTNADKIVKSRKTRAFLLVLAIIFVGTFWRDNPVVDKISHAAVLAFMGARIFVKYL